MQDAWIQLECPSCSNKREGDVAELPGPDEQFRCEDCQDSARMMEFTRTQRDLEILRDFNA